MGSKIDDFVVRMAVTITEGTKTTSESQRADPVVRTPIINPLNIGPR
jgi:hypothetical protein